MVLIDGIQGIGKTSVLRAFRREAEQKGHHVVATEPSILNSTPEDFAYDLVRAAGDAELADMFKSATVGVRGSVAGFSGGVTKDRPGMRSDNWLAETYGNPTKRSSS